MTYSIAIMIFLFIAFTVLSLTLDEIKKETETLTKKLDELQWEIQTLKKD